MIDRIKKFMKRKGLTAQDIVKASFALGSLVFVIIILLYGAILAI